MRIKLFLAACVLALSACATTGDPAQQFINEATKTAQLVDQVSLAASAAIRANALKGQDADTTIATISAARDGIKAARDTAKTDPATALVMLRFRTAALTAAQAYLATLGAPK